MYLPESAACRDWSINFPARTRGITIPHSDWSCGSSKSCRWIVASMASPSSPLLSPRVIHDKFVISFHCTFRHCRCSFVGKSRPKECIYALSFCIDILSHIILFIKEKIGILFMTVSQISVTSHWTLIEYVNSEIYVYLIEFEFWNL